MSLEVIDLKDFLANAGAKDPEVHQELLSKWKHSFEKYGMCHLIGHEVPASAISSLRRAAHDFFSQPSSEKMKCHISPDYGSGGYMPVGIETVAKSLFSEEDKEKPAPPPDLVENLSFVNLEDLEKCVYPEKPSDLKELIRDYTGYMNKLLAAIMEISALCLGLKSDYFSELYGRPYNVLKLSYYPAPKEEGLNVGQLRYGAHSDYGGFTILKIDDLCGGLEACLHGTWIPVPPKRGAFLVIAGDLVRSWTKSRWISPVHRVAQTSNSARLSIIFFTGPGGEMMVEAPDGQGEKSNVLKAEDYLKKKLKSGAT